MFLNEIIEVQYKTFPVPKLGVGLDGNGHIDRSEAEEKKKTKSNRERNWFQNYWN